MTIVHHCRTLHRCNMLDEIGLDRKVSQSVVSVGVTKKPSVHVNYG